MQVICPGCGATFKRSGLPHHIRQSKDPRCHLPNLCQRFRSESENQGNNSTPGPVPATSATDANKNNPEDRFHVSIDPSGDLFGNYAEYEGLTFGTNGDGDQDRGDMDDVEGEDMPEHPTRTQEEEEVELHEALLAEEHQLEPERPQGQLDTTEHEPEDTPSEQAQVPLRLRGGFERPLANVPEIVEFSDQNAGAVYERAHQFGNQGYRRAVTGSSAGGPNQYAPFLSRLDWEVARWAKMRGPGSNSLTELLRIEGVRVSASNGRKLTDLPDKVVERLGLSYKNVAELNKLIDQELPGRPAFQRHEVMVGTEVCDVYFRDVIACIKALFGDPDLAQHLVTIPEKHFTYGSDGRKIRMYHDMHTGKWWWSTQVRNH